MAKRFGDRIIYSADDEMPNCMFCDRCDSDFDCRNWCGAKYGWWGYQRTETKTKQEKDPNEPFLI